jgi:hypothetical protein
MSTMLLLQDRALLVFWSAIARPDIADEHCDEMKFAAALGRDGTLTGLYTLPAEL